MTVRDINCCSNVWPDTEVVIDSNTKTVYEGRFFDIPMELKDKEVWFWDCTTLDDRKDVPMATKVFVALR